MSPHGHNGLEVLMCQHLITNVAQEGKMSVMGEMGGSPGELSSHLVCYEAKTAPQFLNFKMILKTKQTYKDGLVRPVSHWVWEARHDSLL